MRRSWVPLLVLLAACEAFTLERFAARGEACKVDRECLGGLRCDSGVCVEPCDGGSCQGSMDQGLPDLSGRCGPCPGPTEYCNRDGRCVDDCAGRQCGVSPFLSLPCGRCRQSTWYCTLDTGQCVDDCAGIECGPSRTLALSCGGCVAPLRCSSGTCR